MRKGLRALIKKASSNAEWTHCVIYRQALATRHLSSELSEVMTDIVGVVNFIKTGPLTTRVFSAVCEEMGAEHQAVLFHSEARWLSRGKVLSRVFELGEQLRVFLEQEHMYKDAEKCSDENFLVKLAYVSYTFGKLNKLNCFKEKINASFRSQARSALSPRSLQSGAGDLKEILIHSRTCMDLLTLLTMMPPQYEAAFFITDGIF